MITVHEKMLPVTIKCISQQILFSGSVVEKLHGITRKPRDGT